MVNALVTGASGGIGSELCKQLLADEYSVTGWDVVRPPAELDHRIHFLEVDHRQASRVREAASGLPPLDHAVLLAGRGLPSEAETQARRELPDPSTFNASVELNLVGHYNVIHAILPAVRPGGSITLASSVNAVRGYGLPGYSAAKAGLHGLVVSLAPLLGARGVRVNAVDLGTVQTSASETEWAHDAEHFERLRRGSALGRLTTEVEAAQAFVGLMRAFPSATGSVFTVDAGQSVTFSGGD